MWKLNHNKKNVMPAEIHKLWGINQDTNMFSFLKISIFSFLKIEINVPQIIANSTQARGIWSKIGPIIGPRLWRLVSPWSFNSFILSGVSQWKNHCPQLISSPAKKKQAIVQKRSHKPTRFSCNFRALKNPSIPKKQLVLRSRPLRSQWSLPRLHYPSS